MELLAHTAPPTWPEAFIVVGSFFAMGFMLWVLLRWL